MSVDGFHWEGFFRTMQRDITGVVFLIVGTIFGLFVFRLWLKATRLLDDSQKQSARKRSAILLCVITVLSLVGLAWKMAVVASTNRLPRADVDKSGVYQQMDSAGEHAE